MPAAQQVVERAEGAAFAMVAALLGVPSVAACAIVLRIKQVRTESKGGGGEGRETVEDAGWRLHRAR